MTWFKLEIISTWIWFATQLCTTCLMNTHAFAMAWVMLTKKMDNNLPTVCDTESEKREGCSIESTPSPLAYGPKPAPVSPSTCVGSKNSVTTKLGRHRPTGQKTKVSKTSVVSALAMALQLSAAHHNCMSPTWRHESSPVFIIYFCNSHFGDMFGENGSVGRVPYHTSWLNWNRFTHIC